MSNPVFRPDERVAVHDAPAPTYGAAAAAGPYHHDGDDDDGMYREQPATALGGGHPSETGRGLLGGFTIPSNEPLPLRIARVYLQGLNTLRYPLLLTYIVLIVGLAFAAAAFPGDVRTAVEPPTDSAAYHANKLFQEHFPSLQTADTSFLIAQPVSRPVEFTLFNIQWQSFDAMLNYWCFTGMDPPTLVGFTVPNASSWVVSVYSSYRSVTMMGLSGPIADAFLGNGGYATYMQVSYNKTWVGPDKPTPEEFIGLINDKIKQYLGVNGLGDLVTVTPLGVAAFMRDINESTVNDIVLLFGVFTPLALIVFAYTLGSARVVLLPLMSLLATSILTFAFMHFVATHIDVNSLAPGVAAAVCLALSFSYSYTIAAKFQRETLDQMTFGGDRHMIVLELVLAYSGRTVFVSGTCIALCTLGLVFFPIEMLRSIGLSCLFASLSAMFVTLTIIPTLLLCANDFFARGIEACIWPILFDGTHPHEGPAQGDDGYSQSTIGGGAHGGGHAVAAGGNGGSAGPLGAMGEPSILRRTPRAALGYHNAHNGGGGGGGLAAAHRGAGALTADEEVSRIGSTDAMTRASHRVQRVRFFYKHFIAFLAQTPVSVLCIVLVLGACGYPMSMAFSTEYSNDLTQYAPRDSAMLPAWDFMQKTFRAGEVFQYSLVMHFDFVTGFFPFIPPSYPGTLVVRNDTFIKGQRAIEMLVEALPDTTGHAFDTYFWNGLGYGTPDGGPMKQSVFFNCSRNMTGNETSHVDAKNWFDANFQLCARYGIYAGVFLAPIEGGFYTWVQTRLNFNPLSAKGVEWYHTFLRVAPEITRETGISMYLSGYPADTIDLVSFAQDKFPLVVGIVSMILFVSACFLCLSLGVPLRGLVIVFVTTTTCFGIGNLIFCHGILSWMPIAGLQGKEGAVAWLMPFAVLLLVVGIAVHYDLSIVLRVQQFHNHGHETKAAIILAAQETGSEITVSACMTMLLFTGLVFSKVPAMNQLGFYLLLAALLEGIIFRLFLSTTMMAVLGEWNWFPRNVLSPVHTVPMAEDPFLADDGAYCHHASFNPDANASMVSAQLHFNGRNPSVSIGGPMPNSASDVGAARPQPAPTGRSGGLQPPQQRGGVAVAANNGSPATPLQQQPQQAVPVSPGRPTSARQHYGAMEDVETM